MMDSICNRVKHFFYPSYHAVLGIDLGACTIKMVELDCVKKPPLLKNYAIVDAVPKSEDMLLVDFYADLVQRAVQLYGFQAKHAFVSIGERNFFSKEVGFPELTNAELAGAVKWEAERHIPFDASDYYYDYSVIDTKADDGSIRVMLAAAQKDAVDQLMKIYAKTPVEIIAIDGENFSIGRTLRLESAVIVIDLGNTNGRMMVFQHRIPIAFRYLPISGSDFVHADSGLDCGGLSQRLLGVLVDEIEQTIAYYQIPAHQLSLDEILLCGGGASCAGLAEALAERIILPVKCLYPVEGLGMAPALDQRQLRQISPQLTIAIGLALRGADV